MDNERNPWLKISVTDYEDHMSHSSVQQLQIINNITKDQYLDYEPKKLAIFGICTGNGLEHIDNELTTDIYGIDINEGYLNACDKRYGDKLTGLKLFNIDLNREFISRDKVDLVIANLFLEYVSADRFFEQIELIGNEKTVISIVFQKSNRNSFVSNTGIKSLKMLSDLHSDINFSDLHQSLTKRNYRIIKHRCYPAPSNKELIRIDFQQEDR